jgi:hypothetical protein
MYELVFTKKWYHYWPVIIFLYLLMLVSLSTLLNSIFIGIIGFMLLLLFIYLVVSSGDKQMNSLKNQQFPTNLDINTREHDAFIIVHSMDSSAASLSIGLGVLVPYYIHNRFPFKIYHCYNPHEFLEVLKNPNAKYVWIFGHGWRGGITFKWMCSLRNVLARKPNKTHFAYASIRKNLEQYPQKLFIGQFHCNHIEKKFEHNESLVEILLSPSDKARYYITDKATFVFSVWFATRDLLNPIVREKALEYEISPEIDDECTCCC